MTAPPDFLARQFEENRGRLRGVAYRLLGSPAEAEDAVQEAWLRLGRADATAIENLSAWLTTVVSRICLDQLRARASRRETALEGAPAREAPSGGRNPEQEAALADAVGLALLVVLDRLGPAERLAFVLHDLFGVSFEEIGAILERSPVAARQLASRARRRVRSGPLPASSPRGAQRRLVEALLAALRAGDLEALLALLDPDFSVTTDVVAAGRTEVHGARAWAMQALTYRAGARSTRVALVDGEIGAVFAPGGRLARVLRFTFAGGRIQRMEVVTNPARLQAFALTVPEEGD